MTMNIQLENYIKENQDRVVSLLKELCKIPAPSHHEDRRAEFCQKWLKEQGAQGVFIDDALNVIYEYRCDDGPVALFMAHTDTVFPDMEPMGVEEKEDGTLHSPGVGDDTANVAILLIMAGYLAKYQPKTKCGIVIAPNSCEEGLGNLKGSRALIERYGKRLLQSVSFDGYIDDICNCAVGSMRYRVEVLTEGGHSYLNFGRKNAVEYLAKMIERLYQCQVPQDGSKTTYNVGYISGGTSVNTIAQQAEMLYEFRSDNRDSMNEVKRYFENVVEEFRKMDITVNVELVGERPCGVKNNENPKQIELQEICRDVIREVTGRTPNYVAASTDSNIPLSIGIPAATVGLCRGDRAHTRQEWIYIDSLKEGFRIAAGVISSCFE